MINFTVALPAEARALINHFQMQRDQAHAAFPLYRGEHMALVVSGPGKVSAAAATAWLGGLSAENLRAAWLNIGVAGHATHAIGQGLLVNRITDRASGRSWYPPQVHNLDMPGGSLLCVDQPEDDYDGDALFDMEASGFYPAACYFTTGELVQCYKVVSDNRQQPSTGVNAKLCTQLIHDQLPQIDRQVDWLESLQSEYRRRHSPHPDFEHVTGHWHFTVSQQHRLTRLLSRWRVLIPEQPLWSKELESMKSAATVLTHLEQRLDV